MARTTGRPLRPALLIALALAAPLTATADPPDRGPKLQREKVPADSRQTSVLTVPRFGRYAITAKSAQGVALQMVDRMEGPGSLFGAAGEKDGRIDAFLEEGDYLVVTHPAEGSTGDVKLSAVRSRP